MTGLVARCSACGAEMVLRRRHRAKRIACVRCGAELGVPRNIDFSPLDVATRADVDLAEFHAGLLAVSLLACCFFPLPVWTWWRATSAVSRAREEDRVVLPALTRVRALAVALAIVELLWAWFVWYPLVKY